MRVQSQSVGPLVFLLLMTFALVGCEEVPDDCAMSFCGCWEPVTFEYQATAWDVQTETPVEGVEVRCAGTDELLAVSGADGLISFSLETEGSAGCGSLDCNNLDLTPPEGSPYVEATVSTEGTNGGQLVMAYAPD